MLRDPVFEGGAGLHSIQFRGRDQNLALHWTVSVEAGGESTRSTVAADSKKTIDLPLK